RSLGGRAPLPGAGRAAGRAARGVAAAPAWRIAAGGDRTHHRRRPGDGQVAAALRDGQVAREAGGMSRTAPLTPAERELQRQLDAAGGPGPSLGTEARILAAARAAASGPVDAGAGVDPGVADGNSAGKAGPPAPGCAHPGNGARSRRRTRRWIAPLGLAASMALAFGLAWQLRDRK